LTGQGKTCPAFFHQQQIADRQRTDLSKQGLLQFGRTRNHGFAASALKMRESVFDNKAAREAPKLSEILAIKNET
jgi:hypothetical protein